MQDIKVIIKLRKFNITDLSRPDFLFLRQIAPAEANSLIGELTWHAGQARVAADGHGMTASAEDSYAR